MNYNRFKNFWEYLFRKKSRHSHLECTMGQNGVGNFACPERLFPDSVLHPCNHQFLFNISPGTFFTQYFHHCHRKIVV